jgi:hypothetical protein
MLSLRTIFLSGTGVTDKGLAALEKLSNLEHLELRDTKVSEGQSATLREKLPHCAIFGP